MELIYTIRPPGEGSTRLTWEHYFYSPDLDFAVVLFQSHRDDALHPRFEFGESSRIPEGYEGTIIKTNRPDEVVQTLFEKGKQFTGLNPCLEDVIQQLLLLKMPHTYLGF